MITRRRLIQAGGAIGGFIVGQRLGGLPTATAEHPGRTFASAGELYAGFLLLPWGAEAPTLERPSPVSVPATEGPTGGGAVYESLDDSSLRQRIDFPFYKFGWMPKGAHDEGAVVFSNPNGEVISVSRTARLFDAHLGQSGAPVDVLSLSAVRNVPKPIPSWPGGRPEVGLLEFRKVRWAGRAGLLSRSGWSDHFTWVEQDIRYNLQLKLKYVRRPIQDAALALVALA